MHLWKESSADDCVVCSPEDVVRPLELVLPSVVLLALLELAVASVLLVVTLSLHCDAVGLCAQQYRSLWPLATHLSNSLSASDSSVVVLLGLGVVGSDSVVADELLALLELVVSVSAVLPVDVSVGVPLVGSSHCDAVGLCAQQYRSLWPLALHSSYFLSASGSSVVPLLELCVVCSVSVVELLALLEVEVSSMAVLLALLEVEVSSLAVLPVEVSAGVVLVTSSLHCDASGFLAQQYRSVWPWSMHSSYFWSASPSVVLG
jgi:hypothetical protein